MAAARTLFSEHGYEAATIRDIARAAGMSTGAVFANFQDKSDLFEAVLSEDFERVADLLRNTAGANESRPVAERLIDLFGVAYSEGFTDVPLVQAAVAQSWIHAKSAEIRARARGKMTLGVIADLLRHGVHTGEMRADFDVRLISDMLWDAFINNFRRGVFDDWTIQQLLERLSAQIEVILAGLKKA
jgi:AcrR family transcriptional regulator